jgi:hypothetical protein
VVDADNPGHGLRYLVEGLRGILPPTIDFCNICSPAGFTHIEKTTGLPIHLEGLMRVRREFAAKRGWDQFHSSENLA